jgi:hypothetical protein
MIRLLPLYALLAAGCTDGLAPPFLSGDLAASNEDLAVGDLASSTDLRLITVDAGGGVDGPAPRACNTACNCMPGERCNAGFCEFGTVLIYCCGTASCTGSNVCQSSSTGKFSQCNATPDAGAVAVDAGAANVCTATTCTPGVAGDVKCILACGSATAFCTGAGSPHCAP